jgi:putative transposase
VQSGDSLLNVCRYVERNALTAGMVKRAGDWPWSSLWVREHGSTEQKAVLSAWPTDRPRDWTDWVNAAVTDKEKSRWQLSLSRSQPFGDPGWTARTATKLGLEHTMRGEGGAHRAKGVKAGDDKRKKH